jgi:hypothetical protein
MDKKDEEEYNKRADKSLNWSWMNKNLQRLPGQWRLNPRWKYCQFVWGFNLFRCTKINEYKSGKWKMAKPRYSVFSLPMRSNGEFLYGKKY